MASCRKTFLFDEAENLRWFLLPNEAEQCLSGTSETRQLKLPFKPRVYNVHQVLLDADQIEMEGATDGRGKSEEKEETNIVVFRNPPRSILKNVIDVSTFLSTFFFIIILSLS